MSPGMWPLAFPTCPCATPKGPISLMERPNPLPEITSEHLCAQCASLDLNTLLRSENPLHVDSRPWLRSTMGSDCPLCRFLATIAVSVYPYPPPGPDTEIEYCLDTQSFPDAFGRFFKNAVKEKSLDGFKVLGVQMGYFYHGEPPQCCILPVDENSQDPEWPTIREIDPASIDFAILRSWLLYCQIHHPASCGPLEPALLQEIPDLKLIDCQTRQVVKAPRDVTYAALSYVWGKSHAAEMTVSNQSSLPGTVPRTIEDAMQVVLRLDLKYLWVDKYCIDQSSATKLAQQISIMDMIYNAAFCTIVAACGEDASFGLPGVGVVTRREQPAIRLNGQFWVSSLRDPQPVIEASTWASRGWTYQEGLFSRRRLIFTEEQVYFECNHARCRETVSYDLHNQPDNAMPPPGGIFNGSFGHEGGGGLDKHIEAYTKRSLSFQNDIINALSGVFRLYSRMPTPTRHFWGVPMDYNWHGNSCWPSNSAVIKPDPSHRFEDYIDAAFARGLCWSLYKPCPRRPGFPSWSWSGWIGPLADNAWGFLGSLEDSDVKIWLRRANGEHARLTESVVESISKCGPTYPGYTPILRIETWVIDIRLTYFAKGFNGVGMTHQGRDPDLRFFVSDEVSLAGSIRHTVWWLVELSVQVEEGDELHRELCQGTFICILLSRASAFALVVRERAEGVMERIGDVGVYSLIVNSKKYYRLKLNIFDIFPRTRRTILLG